MTSTNSLTTILQRAGNGCDEARSLLWETVYAELRRMASAQSSNESPAKSRQTTAIVHEAFLRLTNGDGQAWANRRHFFSAAAKSMRQILVDDARKRSRLKRGGGRQPAPLRIGDAVVEYDQDTLITVHESLDKLEAIDPRKAEVVMMRVFLGMTEEEAAEALNICRRTVQSDWQLARAWLHRELSKGDTKAFSSA